MGSKNKKQMKGESGGEGKAKGSGGFVADPMISDPRFSSAHTDPRFRRLPKREAKVTLDSRFQSVLTETASAPVDKRGKKRRKGSGKDSLREYYRIEGEQDKKKKKKDESESKSENEKEMMEASKAEAERRKSEVESSEEEEESKSEKLKLASSDEESESESGEEEDNSEEEVSEEEEEDTDEDDEAMYEEEDGFEIPEEEITNIDKETNRLAIVNMDWRHVSAKDLYVIFTSFVPKDGRIVSVSVYPTEFGLERMKDEEIHGPKIDIDKKNSNENEDDEDNDSDEEEEEDEEVINQKLRAYEISRLKYYFAVVECDSVATADFLYKSCDGIEFERSSNKLDLRFIPDSMEFKHPPRDTATEAPSNYEGLEFQSQALQMSKVNLSWDDDEPHRVKTLSKKFKDDQLAALEMKEYIASSDDDESDSDVDKDENADKKEKGTEKYRALLASNKDSEEEDEDDDENGKNDEGMDMEVTFNTGLEDLSKQVREKKDQKESESVWEKYLREKREKKKAKKKNKKNIDDSSDDDYNTKSVKEDGDDDDDFFMDEQKPKKKAKKTKKEEVAVEEERSRAELELLLADENGVGGEGLRGYNIKKRKGSKEAEDEKMLPATELDDSRFAAILSDPLYALDPTDPQFKRSATYVRQLAQKQKQVPESHEEVEAKPEETKKEKRHEMSSTIKSVKMKSLQHKDSDKKVKTGGNAESTLAKIKKKVKDLSRK